MQEFEFLPAQEAALEISGTAVLHGSAGSGKTTALQQRLLHLLTSGEPAYTILVLVAEPPHRDHFRSFLHAQGIPAYADLKIANYFGLAQEMVQLFWPLVARDAGFGNAYQPPRWLGYDLAQIMMWEIVTPMISEGHFADLRLRPQQIVSQLLDNLNRSALNRLPLEEAIERQIASWAGDREHLHHLRDALLAGKRFRNQCFQKNLLDLSLIVHVFDQYIVDHPEFSRYFSERFRHFIIDNLEEQTAAGQHFVRQLMGVTQSTAIAIDSGGGYKRFLGADPNQAEALVAEVGQVLEFEENLQSRPGVQQIAWQVDRFLFGQGAAPEPEATLLAEGVQGQVNGRYRREMLVSLADYLAEQLAANPELQPSDIAIIVPYLDGALRYKLGEALLSRGIPYQIARRRASPREEPRVRTWLTWLALAHPEWGIFPGDYDVAEALNLSLHGLDPARAMLATQALYQPSLPALSDPAQVDEATAARIGEGTLDRIAELRQWLLDHGSASGEPLPLDIFIHQLFTELLSQRHFQPEPDVHGGAVCDWLVRTATRLRENGPALGLNTPLQIGRAFSEGINNGLVTALPPELGDPPDPDGVFISTIYGFLLSEKSVTLQVWLETAASGWWDIPRQSLSNAFVLTQGWNPDEHWTMEDDLNIRNELLSRIVHGLTNRCEAGIILASSELDRRGVRQDGVLWRALSQLTISNEQ